MKNQLTAIALTIMASSAWAQTAQTARTTLPIPDRSTLSSVASPNRTQSGALAAQSRDDFDGDRISTKALVLVDSTGKSVGRYFQGNGYPAILLPYKRHFMAIPLSPDFDANSGVASGGLTWANSTLAYSTPDCTGTAYAGIGTFGSKYIGFAVKDAGKYYAYVGDTDKAVSLAVHSVYDFSVSTCYPMDLGLFSLMPLSVVLPLASTGTPLFFLK